MAEKDIFLISTEVGTNHYELLKPSVITFLVGISASNGYAIRR